jgi:hypothetical protein
MNKPILLTLGLFTLLAATAQASQEQLATSMREARGEATRATEQLKATLDSLNALTKQKEGDLRAAYNTFAAQLPRTENAAAWTRARVRWMAGDGLKYFADWQRTIDSIANENLRKKAQKRLETARKGYDKVAAALQIASEKFGPFLSDLADVQKVLANDVTAGGVKAVKSTVSSANGRFQAVNSAVNNALKEMQKMEESLSTQAR